MKIIDRATFLALPAGTFFCKVWAADCGPLMLKMDTFGEDFIYRQMIEVDANDSDDFARMFIDACKEPSVHDVPLDWDMHIARDGLYTKDQRFGVLDQKECGELIAMLALAAAGITPPNKQEVA